MSFIFLKEDDPAKTVKPDEEVVETKELDFGEVEEGEEGTSKKKSDDEDEDEEEAEEDLDFDEDSD